MMSASQTKVHRLNCDEGREVTWVWQWKEHCSTEDFSGKVRAHQLQHKGKKTKILIELSFCNELS